MIAFYVPFESTVLMCIASDGEGWEHVSITIRGNRCPNWKEMCFIKDLFWGEEDTVIQDTSFFLPGEPSHDNQRERPMPSDSVPLEHPTLFDSEKDKIIQALEESLWIQKDAAHLLGISPRVLNHKIKKSGITHSRWRKNR